MSRLTADDSRLVSERDTLLTADECDLVKVTMGDLRINAGFWRVPLANDDRAAVLEAALIRYVIESRQRAQLEAKQDTPQHRTIWKPASDVVPGEKVWSQGYRWLVNHVMVEPDGRVVLYCLAADLPGRDPAPAGYRDSMSLGYAPGADAVMDVDNLDNAIARKDRR